MKQITNKVVVKDRSNILIDIELPHNLFLSITKPRGDTMKDKLFEPYYKRGFDHFIFKKLLNLKSPKKEAKIFYILIITLILSLALLFG